MTLRSWIDFLTEIFRFFGFSFFFYSREHDPLHVHVEGNGGMAKFEWNGTEFVLVEQMGIKAGEVYLRFRRHPLA